MTPTGVRGGVPGAVGERVGALDVSPHCKRNEAAEASAPSINKAIPREFVFFTQGSGLNRKVRGTVRTARALRTSAKKAAKT